jgi:hypothetical protein
MNKDEFDNRLREFRQRRPFVPFTVELQDGRHLAVKQPQFVFEEGAASFIDPDDGALVEFAHDEVKTMGFLEQESPA